MSSQREQARVAMDGFAEEWASKLVGDASRNLKKAYDAGADECTATVQLTGFRKALIDLTNGIEAAMDTAFNKVCLRAQNVVENSLTDVSYVDVSKDRVSMGEIVMSIRVKW